MSSRNSTQNSTGSSHIIKKVENPGYNKDDSTNFFIKFPGQSESIRQLSKTLSINPVVKIRNSTERISKRGTKERKTTVEIGVFFDAAAYRIFAPHFNYDNTKIRDMLLAYINGVKIFFQIFVERNVVR